MSINLRQRLLCIFAAAGLTVAAGCQSGIGHYLPEVSMPKALARNNGQNAPVPQSGNSTPKITERNYAQVQLALGDSLVKEGKIEAAQAAYEAALRNDDTLAHAYHRLALLREKAGDRSDAKDLLQKAIALDPKNAEIACDYGYCCYLRQDWEEAQTQFERALQLDPNLKRAHNNLGLVYARTNRTDDALRQFERSGLSSADARANLGFVYLTEKRFAEAKAELQLAAAANPGSEKARNILARFEKIESSAQPQQAEIAPAPGQVQTVAASAPAPQPSMLHQFDVPQDVIAPRHPVEPAISDTSDNKTLRYPDVAPPHVANAIASRQASAPSTGESIHNDRSDIARDLPTQQLSPVLSDYQF